METIKYFSVLKGVSLNKLDQNVVEVLLDKNIIIQNESPIYDSASGNDEILDFCELSFNSNSYGTSQDLLDEMYAVLEYIIENGFADHYLGVDEDFYFGSGNYSDLFNVQFQSKAFLDVKERIGFLKRSYSEFYPKDNIDEHLIYNNENLLFPDWRSYFGYLISNFAELVKLYLTCDPKVTWTTTVIGDGKNKRDAIDDIQSFLLAGLTENKKQFEEYGINGFLRIWRRVHENKVLLGYIIDEIKRLEKNNYTKQKTKSKVETNKKNSNSIIKKNVIDYSSLKMIDLFRDSAVYDEFIKKLKFEEIIDKDFNLLKKEGCLDIKLLCAIGFFIIKKGYIKDKAEKPSFYKGERFIDKVLVCMLNNTINGVKISGANYSKHRQNTFDLNIECNEMELLDSM
ncbi:hypothetical protein [Algibacter lectus]|uniref:hypothetical protein n=1 Tax=Algibacter lectus TaxID=221126 RepID=UPI0026F10F82|nr:hypothetical protein [Algibacter lectus]MDO7138277.1 hypothetical protein [Algibacter lectus]